jgi:hypothetical protein
MPVVRRARDGLSPQLHYPLSIRRHGNCLTIGSCLVEGLGTTKMVYYEVRLSVRSSRSKVLPR